MYKSIKDICEYTGYSVSKIKNLYRIRYISELRTIDGELKILSTDYDKIISDYNFITSSYTTNDISEMLDLNLTSVRKLVNKNFSHDYRRILKTIYIPKKVFDNFMQEHDTLRRTCEKGFARLENLIKTYQVERKIAYRMLELFDDKISFYDNVTKSHYVSNTAVQILIDASQLKVNYYDQTDMLSILGCKPLSLPKYSEAIQKVIPDIKILYGYSFYNKKQVDEFIFSIDDLGLENPIDYFIFRSRELILNCKDLKAGKKRFQRLQTHKPYNKIRTRTKQNSKIQRQSRYTQKTYEEVIKTLEFENSIELDKYYSVEEINKLIPHTTKNSVNQSIRRGKFRESIQVRGKNYVLKDEIDSQKKLLESSIEFHKISDELVSKTLKNRVRNDVSYSKYFPNAFKLNVFTLPSWRIPLSDLESGLKRLHEDELKIEYNSNLNKTDDPVDLYLTITEKHAGTQFVDTFKLFKEFVFRKLDKSNALKIRQLASALALTTEYLLNAIEKEIYNYSDDELTKLLKSDKIHNNHKVFIGTFLNWLRDEKPKICRYSNKYNRYQKIGMVDDVYDISLWMEYAEYLTDLEKHTLKAFQNHTYAKTWLYCLLHLCITWRKEDILSIPILPKSSLVNDFDYDWFVNNKFTMTEAQYVINQISKIVDGKSAHKNGVRAHFAIPPLFVLPISIAYLTVHNNISKHKVSTSSIFGKTQLFKSHFEKFFEPEKLKGFQNRKANRSLLTHSFNNAVLSEGMSDIAFSLSTSLRSHLIDETGYSNTTAMYICSTNSDGDTSNVLKHLFRRGEFGWLYNSLVRIATADTQLSMEEVTKQIELVKMNYSPFAIDNVMGYMLNVDKEKIDVIQEVLDKPQNEVMNILERLNNNDMPSKTKFISCLKNDGIKLNCPYPKGSSCCGCKYNIPLNYSLSVLKGELDILINKLMNTPVENVVMRMKYTHLIFKDLGVIEDAIIQFHKWDENYIESFINMEKLTQKLEVLEKESKFLLTE